MKRSILPLLAILLLAMTACDFEPSPKLSVSPNPLEVSAEGGQVTLSVSAVGKWKTKSVFARPYGPRFYYVTPYSGTGNADITVIFEPNLAADWGNRGEIQFECVSGERTRTLTLPVAQGAADPIYELIDWKEIKIPANGGSFSVTLSYNCRGGIKLDAEGVTVIYKNEAVEEERLWGTTEITFHVSANPSSQDREIHVSTYSGQNRDKPLNVYKFTQAGS